MPADRDEQQAESTVDGAAEAPAQASAPDAEQTLVAPEDELAAARKEAEDYRTLLQRERADFINFRRRVEGERAGQVGQARADAVLPFLPILDDLERAAGEVPAELREQPWVKGVLLIADKLQSALKTAGLERIEALGEPFDPRLHEAFMSEARADVPAGHVSSVWRTGYRLGDRVLRAAQVAVSQGAPDDGGEGATAARGEAPTGR